MGKSKKVATEAPKLTVEQELDAAIEAGDLGRIKAAREALKNTPKPKRKYMKKAAPKQKLPKKTQRPTKFKNDNEYIKYMAQLEDARRKLLIAGQGGPLVGSPIVSIDSKEVFKKDQKIDKKITKSRSPRRPGITIEKRKCLSCSNQVEIPSNMIHLYNYDIGNSNSEKPNFYCGSCGV